MANFNSLLSDPSFMMGMGLLGNQGRMAGGFQGLQMANQMRSMKGKKSLRDLQMEQIRTQMIQKQQAQERQTKMRAALGTPQIPPSLETMGAQIGPPQTIPGTPGTGMFSADPAAQQQAMYGAMQYSDDPFSNMLAMQKSNVAQKPFSVGKGASVYNPAKGTFTSPPIGPSGGPDLGDKKKMFEMSSSLRKEYTKATDEYAALNDSYGRIQASVADPSAAGDIALIFNFMKMLDPRSTVREGEFATAQNAGGVGSRIIALYNSVKSGQRLSQETRGDFLDRSGRLYNEATEGYNKRVDRYTNIAQQWGIDPSRTIFTRSNYPQYQKQTPEAPPPKITIPEKQTPITSIKGEFGQPVTLFDFREINGVKVARGNDGRGYYLDGATWKRGTK